VWCQIFEENVIKLKSDSFLGQSLMGAVGGGRAAVKVPRAAEGEWHLALFLLNVLLKIFRFECVFVSDVARKVLCGVKYLKKM